MLSSFLFPRRCLCCAEPLSNGVLCRACVARYQSPGPPGPDRDCCRVCGQVKLAEADLCMDCMGRETDFTSLEGLFGYQEAGAELLRLYKFGGQSALVRSWAGTAASRLFPRGPLVPVPPLRKNLLRRGWDPVDFLARHLAREAGVPVWRVLTRRPSASQKTLDREHRTENARKAYDLGRRTRWPLAGTPLVWLIDDVVTTGATVEACSRALVQAGVREVKVFCLGLH